jgi:hypothetical protein
LGRGEASLASDSIRAASVPDAPSIPEKADATTSMIQITWNAPIYNGGNAISDYLVYMSISDNTNFFELGYTNDASITDWTVTGLDRGELYYFKVSAFNIIGESSFSDENSILAATVPLQPAQPTIAV